MMFVQDNVLCFVASVNNQTSAILDGTTIPIIKSAYLSSTCSMDATLWHRRLAHLNLDSVKLLIKDKLVEGLILESNKIPNAICEPCLAGKQHCKLFPISQTRASKPLELIHTDLHGPMPVQTHSGYRYWALFIDDCKCFRSAHPLHNKDDVLEAFKQFTAWAETQLGYKSNAYETIKVVNICQKSLNNSQLLMGSSANTLFAPPLNKMALQNEQIGLQKKLLL